MGDNILLTVTVLRISPLSIYQNVSSVYQKEDFDMFLYLLAYTLTYQISSEETERNEYSEAFKFPQCKSSLTFCLFIFFFFLFSLHFIQLKLVDLKAKWQLQYRRQLSLELPPEGPSLNSGSSTYSLADHLSKLVNPTEHQFPKTWNFRNKRGQ